MKERWSDLDANLQSTLLEAFSNCLALAEEKAPRNNQFFFNAIWSLSVLGFRWCALSDDSASESCIPITSDIRAYMHKLLNDQAGINGIAVATVFDSLAKLECPYTSVDRSLSQSLEVAVISWGADLSPRELATIVYSMGKMGGRLQYQYSVTDVIVSACVSVF